MRHRRGTCVGFVSNRRLPFKLSWEEQKNVAATGVRMVHVGASVCAFVVVLSGLLALAVCPIFGVLLTLAGMALLLYGAAGLCGARQKKEL